MTPELAADFKPDAVIASSTYPMDIWVARRIARRAARGRSALFVDLAVAFEGRANAAFFARVR